MSEIEQTFLDGIVKIAVAQILDSCEFESVRAELIPIYIDSTLLLHSIS
jgi:hypothetical protein